MIGAGAEKYGQENFFAKSEKRRKKVLTNAKECDRILKLSEKGQRGTLKIEQ